MATKKEQKQPLANDEIRSLMLSYFYNRNKNATSSRGKKGSSVKISDVKRELKASHELTQQQVQSNLTYLISQGWVKEDAIEKSFTAPGGTVIPSTTHFYTITAAGIDKIEGPGEFTMPKFHGIKRAKTSSRSGMAIKSMLSLATSVKPLPIFAMPLRVHKPQNPLSWNWLLTLIPSNRN